MVVAFVRTHQWDQATNRLRGIYQKALYESSELTEGMAVNFNKFSVAGGPARELLLTDVIRQAQGVQADLAVLPLSGSAIAPAMKYINQAGDFCQRPVSYTHLDVYKRQGGRRLRRHRMGQRRRAGELRTVPSIWRQARH